jgi:hypothetical protein
MGSDTTLIKVEGQVIEGNWNKKLVKKYFANKIVVRNTIGWDGYGNFKKDSTVVPSAYYTYNRYKRIDIFPRDCWVYLNFLTYKSYGAFSQYLPSFGRAIDGDVFRFFLPVMSQKDFNKGKHFAHSIIVAEGDGNVKHLVLYTRRHPQKGDMPLNPWDKAWLPVWKDLCMPMYDNTDRALAYFGNRDEATAYAAFHDGKYVVFRPDGSMTVENEVSDSVYVVGDVECKEFGVKHLIDAAALCCLHSKDCVFEVVSKPGDCLLSLIALNSKKPKWVARGAFGLRYIKLSKKQDLAKSLNLDYGLDGITVEAQYLQLKRGVYAYATAKHVSTVIDSQQLLYMEGHINFYLKSGTYGSDYKFEGTRQYLPRFERTELVLLPTPTNTPFTQSKQFDENVCIFRSAKDLGIEVPLKVLGKVGSHSYWENAYVFMPPVTGDDCVPISIAVYLAIIKSKREASLAALGMQIAQNFSKDWSGKTDGLEIPMRRYLTEKYNLGKTIRKDDCIEFVRTFENVTHAKLAIFPMKSTWHMVVLMANRHFYKEFDFDLDTIQWCSRDVLPVSVHKDYTDWVRAVKLLTWDNHPQVDMRDLAWYLEIKSLPYGIQGFMNGEKSEYYLPRGTVQEVLELRVVVSDDGSVVTGHYTLAEKNVNVYKDKPAQEKVVEAKTLYSSLPQGWKVNKWVAEAGYPSGTTIRKNPSGKIAMMLLEQIFSEYELSCDLIPNVVTSFRAFTLKQGIYPVLAWNLYDKYMDIFMKKLKIAGTGYLLIPSVPQAIGSYQIPGDNGAGMYYLDTFGGTYRNRFTVKCFDVILDYPVLDGFKYRSSSGEFLYGKTEVDRYIYEVLDKVVVGPEFEFCILKVFSYERTNESHAEIECPDKEAWEYEADVSITQWLALGQGLNYKLAVENYPAALATVYQYYITANKKASEVGQNNAIFKSLFNSALEKYSSLRQELLPLQGIEGVNQKLNACKERVVEKMYRFSLDYIPDSWCYWLGFEKPVKGKAEVNWRMASMAIVLLFLLIIWYERYLYASIFSGFIGVLTAIRKGEPSEVASSMLSAGRSYFLWAYWPVVALLGVVWLFVLKCMFTWIKNIQKLPSITSGRNRWFPYYEPGGRSKWLKYDLVPVINPPVDLFKSSEKSWAVKGCGVRISDDKVEMLKNLSTDVLKNVTDPKFYKLNGGECTVGEMVRECIDKIPLKEEKSKYTGTFRPEDEGLAPKIPTPDQIGALDAFLNRHCTPKVMPDAKSMDLWERFCRLHKLELRDFLEVQPFEEYLKSVEAKKRNSYKQGYLTFIRTGQLIRQLLVQVKPDESQHKLGSPNPTDDIRHLFKHRAIQGPHKTVKAVCGWMNWMLTKYVKRSEDVREAFVQAMTFEEIEEIITKYYRIIPNCVLVEIDQKNHDAHQDERAISFVDKAYFEGPVRTLAARVGFNKQQVDNIIEAMFSMDIPFKMFYQTNLGRFPAMKGKLKRTTPSGHPNLTTLGNTVRVIKAFQFIGNRIGLVWRKDFFVLQSGDDTLLMIDEAHVIRFREEMDKFWLNEENMGSKAVHGLGMIYQGFKVDRCTSNFLSKEVSIICGKAVMRRQLKRFIATGCVYDPKNRLDEFNWQITQQGLSGHNDLPGYREHLKWRDLVLSSKRPSNKKLDKIRTTWEWKLSMLQKHQTTGLEFAYYSQRDRVLTYGGAYPAVFRYLDSS